jgi:chemotaxis protein methyltransferase CheR
MTNTGDPSFVLSDEQFNFLRGLVADRAGIELADTKRELVYGRLTRRIRKLNLPGFTEYCALLRDPGHAELAEFINAITTNLTSFFREAHHFDFLRAVAVPEWLRGRSPVQIRVWSAGCSTGEEPYSIAMTLLDAVAGRQVEVSILATDIDTHVLATAQAGIYPAERLAAIPREYQHWVPSLKEKAPEQGMIAKPVIDVIQFRQLNLMGAWSLKGPMDLIFCRNVGIYFGKQAQRRLFDRFAETLAPGGLLVVGHSETLTNLSDRFELIGRTIYRKRH